MIKEMMTSEQINSVIDKLAEKLGVAATKIEPLVGQTIEQYSQMHLAMFKFYSWCTVGIIFAILTVIIGGIVLCIRFYKNKEMDDENKGCYCFVTFLIMVVFGLVAGCGAKSCFDCSMEHLSAGMSPVTSILGIK